MVNIQDGSKIDIERIMKEIMEKVKHKKQLGIYTDADIQDISRLSLDIPAGASISSSRLSDQIAFLRNIYDFRVGYQISSHRSFLGRTFVAVKRFFISLILKLASPVWDKSVSYNFHVLQLVNSMAEEIENLKKECERLKQQHKTEIKPENTIDRDKV